MIYVADAHIRSLVDVEIFSDNLIQIINLFYQKSAASMLDLLKPQKSAQNMVSEPSYSR